MKKIFFFNLLCVFLSSCSGQNAMDKDNIYMNGKLKFLEYFSSLL